MTITLPNGITITGDAIHQGQLFAKFQVHLEEKYGIDNEKSFALLIDNDAEKQEFYGKTQEWVDLQKQGLNLSQQYSI